MKSTTARRDVGRMGSVRGLGSMGSQGKIIWMNICGKCICWICRRVRGGRGVGDGFLGVLSLLSLLSFPFLPFLFYSFVLWSILLGRVFLLVHLSVRELYGSLMTICGIGCECDGISTVFLLYYCCGPGGCFFTLRLSRCMFTSINGRKVCVEQKGKQDSRCMDR